MSRLNAQIVKILSEPELAKRFAGQGAEPQGTTGKQLAQYRRSEYERWRKLSSEMKLKAE